MPTDKGDFGFSSHDISLSNSYGANLDADQYHHEDETAEEDCESQGQDDHGQHNIEPNNGFPHYTTKIMTILVTDKHGQENLRQQAPIVGPGASHVQANCFVAYDLVDHGAIFSNVNTEPRKTSKHVELSPTSVFLQSKSMRNLYLDEKKKQLVEKFPIKVPKLTIDKTSHISSSFGGGQVKIEPIERPIQIGKKFAELNMFVVKSPEHSNELHQQMIHQTEINQLGGEIAITNSGHQETTDANANDGFDPSSVIVTNKKFTTTQRESPSTKRNDFDKFLGKI